MNSGSSELLVIALLLVLNGLFALAEMALILVSSRRSRLKQLAEEGSEAAKTALSLADNPNRFLPTVQFGSTLSSVLTGGFGGAVIAGRLNRWLLQTWPQTSEYSAVISFACIVLGITFVTIVVGELVPKRLALAHPERWAMALARPMSILSRFAAPFIWLLGACTNVIARVLGAGRHQPAPVTEAEVAALIDQGLRSGVFHKAEKQMVEGVMSLDQCQVTALMTPRPKLVWLNIDDADEVNWRKIVASGHSHFPVFQGLRDNVMGMASVKALWANAAFNLPTTLKNLLTPPLIVPESTMALQALETFKKTGKHVALIADEFGGIQGMLTLIDVLEAIVGDLPDQLRRAQPEARKRDDGSWLIDGTIAAGEIRELLGLKELPGENSADFQTLGGFIMTHFGRVPAAGDHFEAEGWRFEVVDMDRQRVDKVLVSRLPEVAGELEEKASA
ncbi:MAG TPA: hemolysin family protein [Candidatus Didemnitutus sp.]|nr:hemolysin family protein [Candidatus Didemnitutus sp.]